MNEHIWIFVTIQTHWRNDTNIFFDINIFFLFFFGFTMLYFVAAEKRSIYHKILCIFVINLVWKLTLIYATVVT